MCLALCTLLVARDWRSVCFILLIFCYVKIFFAMENQEVVLALPFFLPSFSQNTLLESKYVPLLGIGGGCSGVSISRGRSLSGHMRIRVCPPGID